jgi:hypothetical protein
MKHLAPLAPLVALAAAVTALLAWRATMTRGDRLVLLGVLVAAYGGLLVLLRAGLALLRRAIGRHAGLARWLPDASLLIVLVLTTNVTLVAVGRKDATYQSASWLMRQPSWLQWSVVAFSCCAAAMAVLHVRHSRWWSAHGSESATMVALLAIVVALLPPGPSRPTGFSPSSRPSVTPHARSAPPLLLVGVDGLDPLLLEAALGQGNLPELRSLADTYITPIGNDDLGHTPPVWTTIATGSHRSQHQVYDFVTRRSPLFARPLDAWWERIPPGFAIKTAFSGLARVGLVHERLVDGRDRSGPSIWQILSSFGLRSLVVNFPVSYPAEIVNGVFVASNAYQAATAASEGPDMAAALAAFSSPPTWLAAAVERVQPQPSRPDDPIDLAWKELGFLRALAKLALDRDGPFDFITFYTPLIDGFNHRLSPSEYESMRAGHFGDPLPARYLAALTEIDATLHALRRSLPQATAVLLMSDHGVTRGFRQGKHVLQHRLGCPGVLLAANVAVARHTTPPTIYDVAPTLLAYFGAPPGSAMPGRVLTGISDRVGVVSARFSYDAWIPNARVASGAGELPAVRERLKALGYVE